MCSDRALKSLPSLERIQQYVTIEQEPKPSAEGQPPAYWPASGSLRVENLSARYSLDGPKVLHNLSFEIKSGERVGVGKSFVRSRRSRLMCCSVGRTGSGKVRRKVPLCGYAELFSELLDFVTLEVYSYRRLCVLRRSPDIIDEPRRSAHKHNHYPANGEYSPHKR